MQNTYWPAAKKVTVLTEDIGFRSFSHDRSRQNDDNILKFFDWNMQPNSLDLIVRTDQTQSFADQV
jgi:hypothetical protein